MKVLFLTPGTGSFYCGSCMRDAAIVRELNRLDVQAQIIPMYLPIQDDVKNEYISKEVLFGGVNVFLQQNISFFRSPVPFIDKILDSNFVLSKAAKKAAMTDASDLGPLTVSMLKGEKGNQAKEIVKLIKYIEQGDKPDIICLSNILLIGLAESLKHHFKLPIVCYLQGEDFFIEGLADSFTRKSWELIKKQSQFVDSFVAVSDYYGGVIHDRSEIELEKIEVIHNGIDLDGYDQMPEKNYEADIHIGYLSRICPGKGLNMLIDAFIDLKRKPQFSHVKLDVCGTITEADRVYLDEIISRLEKFNLMQDVRIIENVTREEKLKFLEDIHLLCVPALYGEAFGLYVIEAMAASVAVLQPETASFPELISATQGGELYQAHIPMSLIDSLSELLLDTEKLRTMGVRAKKSVFEKFSITHCSEKHKKLFERLLT